MYRLLVSLREFIIRRAFIENSVVSDTRPNFVLKQLI